MSSAFSKIKKATSCVLGAAARCLCGSAHDREAIARLQRLVKSLEERLHTRVLADEALACQLAREEHIEQQKRLLEARLGEARQGGPRRRKSRRDSGDGLLPNGE